MPGTTTDAPPETLSSSSPPPTNSPESNVSPRTQPSQSKDVDYFSVQPHVKKSPPKVAFSTTLPSKSNEATGTAAAATGAASGRSISTDTSVSSTPSDVTAAQDVFVPTSTVDGGDSAPDSDLSRKSSITSVSFRLPRNPRLPQGQTRGFNPQRLRNSSPDSVRFKAHVGFDNLPVGEATKWNTASCTLNVRHSGYHPRRRSRTFMVGVDDHDYSDCALIWLLNSMVDDGDEVVCVRVIENALKLHENYQELAQKMLDSIQAKNVHNKAISIILEYSVGKLHDTFQQLIQIYQPSMLIVGTRGRSLGGIQSLMNSRNSFSKYCLQYSPVPVVVVRPDEMRQKKKDKRNTDPSRQTYTHILAQYGGKHEIDSEASSIYELERVLSPDEEAHRVAAAIGLPAAFDPTIKPYKGGSRRSSPGLVSPLLTGLTNASPDAPAAENESDNDESGEEEEYEIEAVSANQIGNPQTDIQRQQKERLHAMEVGEAAALLKSGAGAQDEEDEEDDDSQEGGANGNK